LIIYYINRKTENIFILQAPQVRGLKSAVFPGDEPPFFTALGVMVTEDERGGGYGPRGKEWRQGNFNPSSFLVSSSIIFKV
jgi:hypothetical protein